MYKYSLNRVANLWQCKSPKHATLFAERARERERQRALALSNLEIGSVRGRAFWLDVQYLYVHVLVEMAHQTADGRLEVRCLILV